MQERTQNKCRWLLYVMTIEIRSGGGSLWNPRHWGRKELRYRQRLADAFHNLAWYSSQGFEGFQPDWFWRDLEGVSSRAFDYRAIFTAREAREDRWF